MRKCIIVILIIILMISLYLLQFFITTNFESLTGLREDNIDKIIIGDKLIKEGYDEFIILFKSYEYKRLFNNNFDFQKEFPNGLRTYTITIYSTDGDVTHVHPTGNKMLINNQLYEIDGNFDHKSLIDLYESL